MTYTFEAKYYGHCAGECGNPINPSDLIYYGEGDVLMHAGCTERVERPEVICERCFLVKPCGCDD